VSVSGGLSGGHATPAANGPVASAPEAASDVEGAACYLRPGDAGFDECEACQ
jgi:ribonucleoside-diphosphate reductase alpha chain